MFITLIVLIAASTSLVSAALVWVLLYQRRERALLIHENESLRRRARLVSDAEGEAARIRAEAAETLAKAVESAETEEQRRSTLAEEALEITGRLDTLRADVESLEERSRLQSVAFYTPRYPEHTPERFRKEEEWLRSLQVMMLREKTAARCDADPPIEGASVDSVLVLMLRALNAESDAALARADRTNVQVMEARVRKAFETINRMGAWHRCTLNDKYLELKLSQLRITCEYRDLMQGNRRAG